MRLLIYICSSSSGACGATYGRGNHAVFNLTSGHVADQKPWWRRLLKLWNVRWGYAQCCTSALGLLQWLTLVEWSFEDSLLNWESPTPHLDNMIIKMQLNILFIREDYAKLGKYSHVFTDQWMKWMRVSYPCFVGEWFGIKWELKWRIVSTFYSGE